jgi:cell division transport system ATP-binding protein
MNLFVQFQQVGVSVMIASHDLGLVERLPYRQLPLKNGALAETDARVVQ